MKRNLSILEFIKIIIKELTVAITFISFNQWNVVEETWFLKRKLNLVIFTMIAYLTKSINMWLLYEPAILFLLHIKLGKCFFSDLIYIIQISTTHLQFHLVLCNLRICVVIFTIGLVNLGKVDLFLPYKNRLNLIIPVLRPYW